MKIFGLIGHPLSHSFSKGYFTEKFKKEGLSDCYFENYDIPKAEDIYLLLKNVPCIHGLCVTIPYKQSVIPFLNRMDDTVKEIAACNSIKISNGILTGYNTDTVGFKKSLLSNLSLHHKKALVLGTGGSAKAVAYVLRQLNIDYLFVSRRSGAHHDNIIGYKEISSKTINEYTLIVNCTPRGMFPNINEAPFIPYDQLTSSHYLFDLTYNPTESLFLKKGKDQGATIQNGYDMLIYQAEASWKIWNENE